MPQYRKSNNSDTWHWAPGCSKKPKKNYTTRNTKPTTGELCNECKAKSRKGK